MEENKYCQSCALPLAKDKQGGGTNSDGSRSNIYCSKCYKNGEYTQPNITMEEMIYQVSNKMKQLKVPSFLSNFYIRKIPKLRRWQ